jgi:hypothetical protein
MTSASDDHWAERLLEQLKDMGRSLDTIAHSIRGTQPDTVLTPDSPPRDPDDTPEHTQPGPDEV